MLQVISIGCACHNSEDHQDDDGSLEMDDDQEDF